MKEYTIFEALKATKPPPCEKFACNKYALCASELLACKSFQFYVTSGRCITPRHSNNIGPNKAIYNKLYNDKDDDE